VSILLVIVDLARSVSHINCQRLGKSSFTRYKSGGAGGTDSGRLNGVAGLVPHSKFVSPIKASSFSTALAVGKSGSVAVNPEG
jgi:hypothetical protein